MTDTTELLELLGRFTAMARERAKTLPYQVNLIETLGGACETEHSKLLTTLLRYKTSEGRFELLESLIAYIQSRYGIFSGIKVERPCIDTEHRRIDIYVRQTGQYAIILENKSNWAQDQNQQLARYIETAKDEGFEENHIHILYCPPLEDKEPDEQSWGRYKDAFKDRYRKLSWRDDLLPWMKEKVLPNVRAKDIPLASALQQYVNYWEGVFGLTGVDNEVKAMMEQQMRMSLALSDDVSDISEIRNNWEKIKSTQNGLAELTACVGMLSQKTFVDFLVWFSENLARVLQKKGYEITDNDIEAMRRRGGSANYIKFFALNFDGKPYYFALEFGTMSPGMYYGFTLKDCEYEKQTCSAFENHVAEVHKRLGRPAGGNPAWFSLDRTLSRAFLFKWQHMREEDFKKVMSDGYFEGLAGEIGRYINEFKTE
jgi:hypothetical protein